MDTIVNENKSNGTASGTGNNGSHKESIKKMLYAAIGNAFDDETQQATREMAEVRENAIKQIVEEQKAVINKIKEDERKTIWSKVLDTNQSGALSSDTIRESITQSYTLEKSIAIDAPVSGSNHRDTAYQEVTELEVLPPRDQDAINAINLFLSRLSETKKVDIVNLVDKSVFKVELKEPVNFIEKLGSLPQILNAEEVIENGRKKIKITLSVKQKLERNQDEVNTKINKMFFKKK